MEGDIKVRANPIVTKLDTPEFKSIFTEELYNLIDLFKKYNYELRIAGGAVRDLLMNVKPKDIDFATTATPDQMKEMFTKEEVRMINMKGEKHGTITPRINNKENFEITTLRVDVVTDGRHAEVQFTTDWQLDANRRDLTINSMFLGFDGSVYDYFYGYEDLKIRRVIFIGDPDKRIKEDFLRILRYFRFYGRVAERPDNHDKAIIKAVVKNASGLQQLSGEKIWLEVRKILEGNFAFELIKEMIACGISKYIGLPQKPNIEEFERLHKASREFKDPLFVILYITAMLHTYEDAVKFHERIRLTAIERDLMYFIIENRNKTKEASDIMVYKKLCIQPGVKQEFVVELLKYNGKQSLYEELKEWKVPPFRINGNLLKERGCPRGKAIGIVMAKLKIIWANDNFQTSTEDLLNVHYPKLIEELNSENYSNKKLKITK